MRSQMRWFLLSVFLITTLMLTSASADAADHTIVTFAGGSVGDGGPATSGVLYSPYGIAVDGSGNVYVADSDNCRVREVSGGVITTVAGNGTCGDSGDGGPANSAGLAYPDGIAVDAAGNLFIAEAYTCRIREVSAGTITTIAGNGWCGYGGDGGPATSANLQWPTDVAVDNTGNVYIADNWNCRIREVSGGIMTTIAGSGTCGFAGDGGPATSASLYWPKAIAVDGAGNLYIADFSNCRIREVISGTITTVAGNGTCGSGGDGGPATAAEVADVFGMAVDGSGNLYMADLSACRIRSVIGGTIATVSGTGSCTYSGDGGAAANASLYQPRGVALDGAGAMYIPEAGDCRVRRVIGGTIATVAGNGTCGFGGDGGPAESASLSAPAGVATAGANDLYVADSGNCRVRKISGGTITTVVGSGSCGYGGDGGPATSARLNAPEGVAVDGAGNLYIADVSNCRVREVSGGIITTVAGNGTCGYAGDGGPATGASLYWPRSIVVDGLGNLYIADEANCRVRKISTGTITTVAGSAACGFSGDGGPATGASLWYPYGVALDGAGNLYIADSSNCRVRKVSAGTITTVAGSSSCGYAGDGGPATSAQLWFFDAIALDGAGNLYIADADGCRLREVVAGTIATIAGNGTCGYGGDGGPATSARLNRSKGVAVDSSGNVYFADLRNNRIREIIPATSGGGPAPSVGGVAQQVDRTTLRSADRTPNGRQALAFGTVAAAGVVALVALTWRLSRRYRRR